MTPPASIEHVRVHAPAKINLCLHVGARRTDGFHELESLVAFTEFGDELGFVLGRFNALSMSIHGPFADSLSGNGDNLILKAARLLAETVSVTPRVQIALNKCIPVASGVGGGSADAAAALRGLAQLWNVRLPAVRMLDIAAAIGSDVPVCLGSEVAWMEGRGERVRPLPKLPPTAMVLVNPNVQVSTADVFRRLDKRRGTGSSAPAASFADTASLARYLETTSNDLEAPAIQIAPVIGEVLEELKRLPGVLFARMSGSGATCFALMENSKSADAGAGRVLERHPNWWAIATSAARENIGEPRTG
jgi:4-diphosphocytidyl-2-C-methyl-D-erythritol kinase